MAKMKKCPVCSRSMKIENLEKHIKKVHPREKVEIEYTEKEEKALKAHDRKQRELTKPAGLWKIGAVIVAIIIIFVGSTFLLQSPPQSSEPPPSGTPYTDFTLTDTDGNTVRLSDWEGQVMYVVFFKTGCPACQQYTETLWLLHQNYGSQIKMLSVDMKVSNTNEVLEAFKEQYNATWQFALDTAGVKDLYNIGSYPSGILIDPQGNIVFSHIEAVDYETIRDQVVLALES